MALARKISILGICFYGFSVIVFVVMAAIETIFLYLEWISTNWKGLMLNGMLTWICCSLAITQWNRFIYGLKKIVEEEEKR